MRNLNTKQKERLSGKLLKAPMTYKELLEICHTTKSLMNFLDWIYENGGDRNPKNYPFTRPVFVQDKESPDYVNSPSFHYDKHWNISVDNVTEFGTDIPWKDRECHILADTDLIYVE